MKTATGVKMSLVTPATIAEKTETASVQFREITIALPTVHTVRPDGQLAECGRSLEVKLTQKGARGLRLLVDGYTYQAPNRSPVRGGLAITRALEAIVDAVVGSKQI